MPGAIITLTTDFGNGSPYIAAMKGAILSVNPEATIIDLTHSVPSQNVRQGAISLVTSVPDFPEGTIHVAVVDPGVGTDRFLLCVTIGGCYYLAPDNGLLDGLARRINPDKIIALTESGYWLAKVSDTFHGRDILAPVAAHLSLGVRAELLGDPLSTMKQLSWPEVHVMPGKIEGVIESVDSFGNLVSNIEDEMLGDVPRDDSVRIVCDEHETQGIYRTYGDHPPLTLIALIGSGRKLELAIVNDSAALMLGVGTGAKLSVLW
jgi:S-adenosylmethionine hydrolase